MFLKNQMRQILQNQGLACVLVACFAVLPYTLWFSLAIIALVTLRKGTYPGLTVTICGMVAYLFPGYLGLQNTFASEWILLAFPVCYFSAYILKISENWAVVLPVILGTTWIGLIGFQYLLPNYMEASYQAFLHLVQEAKLESGLSDVLVSQALRDFMPFYLGIEGVALVGSALFPVVIARYLQAQLFYPEGFRKELLAFRAHRIALILLISCFLLIRYGNMMVASCLPLLTFYLVFSGFGVAYRLLQRQNDRTVLMLLCIPAILLPYIVFPIFLILGCFDSLIRVRTKLEAS